MDRPNMANATKAITRYVEGLERDLEETKRALAILAEEGVPEGTDEEERIVGYIDGANVGQRLPVLRKSQRIIFEPWGPGYPTISLRWEDNEGGYLDVNAETRGYTFSVRPWAANAMRLILKED